MKTYIDLHESILVKYEYNLWGLIFFLPYYAGYEMHERKSKYAKTYSFMISRETWVSGNIRFLINFIEFKLYQVQLV